MLSQLTIISTWGSICIVLYFFFFFFFFFFFCKKEILRRLRAWLVQWSKFRRLELWHFNLWFSRSAVPVGQQVSRSQQVQLHPQVQVQVPSGPVGSVDFLLYCNVLYTTVLYSTVLYSCYCYITSDMSDTVLQWSTVEVITLHSGRFNKGKLNSLFNVFALFNLNCKYILEIKKKPK